MAREVTMYRTRFCAYCVLAKRLLEKKGVAFSEIDVSGDSAKRAWLRQVTGSHTVPQVFIGEQSIGGYVELYRLDRSGDLDRLLAAS
jgi:glutaredoxin 3